MASRPRDGSGRWSRSRGLPAPAYAAWSASLAADHRSPSRILAWATTPDGFAIGLPGALSIGSESVESGPVWTHLGWHRIEHGGWDVATRRLSWRTYVGEGGGAGERGGVELTAPGRLPELFRERVAASIVLERFVPLTGDRGVVITARRDLADGTEIDWHTTLTRGLTWVTPGVRETVDSLVAELRTEYDVR